MQTMTLEQMADYIEYAQITATQDFGHALVHRGTNAVGSQFVLVADVHGKVAVFESL